MKLLSSRRQRQLAQILAEACIGLSLMTFAWILIAYSLYLANYQIRTEMAARYAAWYTGNNNGTLPTPAQLDQFFFMQPGLSSVTMQPPVLLPDVITSSSPSGDSFTNDNTSGNGPYRVQVSFGVSSLNISTNPFPFNLMNPNIKVPMMPSLALSTTSVNSTCQWDGDSDTWNTFSSAASGIWNTISSNLSQGLGPIWTGVSGFFSSLF
jgi:hypothetical protein